MKEKFVKYILLLVAFLSVFYAVAALADNNYGLEDAVRQSSLPTSVAGGETTLPGIAGKLLQYGFSLIGIVFFGMMLYAGFLWMSAMGNTEKVDSAKQIFETAIIGLVLILAAYAITNFVFTSLT